MKFSFEQRPTDMYDWIRSSNSFDTIEEAAKKAAEWMAISFENDFPVEVRLISIG